MKIGVPKEVKNNENRVALTPGGVVQFVQQQHKVFVEKGAGLGSGFSDQEYEKAGAALVDGPEDAWEQEMVLKVKEPVPEEYGYFREGLLLFTYLHLAPLPELTQELMNKKVTAVAYETVQLDNGSLPLLTPMSEVAGRMATQMGAAFLEKTKGGKGILLAGVPGVSRGKVTIIGGGTAGTNAAKIAVGLGADVTILDVNPMRLRELDDIFGTAIQTKVSNSVTIGEAVQESDVVVGAVLIPGAKAPKLVTEDMVKSMGAGSVLVDIAIDQGGIFETTDKITTHDHPVYTKHDVTHYAVANMPGAVPRTSTLALTNVTVPYALALANKGVQQACRDDAALLKGINTHVGHLVYEAVADAQNLPFTNVNEILA
ncbi:L-alanine dehydrogenase [Alteribacillus persepolensis]|uniref:Alanine dehydrogenase n=1 Tax=Alteribacillus persepolensis TaxID=568899 RepID=A0A1G8BJ62_9BACI|nr:alanine dehydrogenase [Alteribacillus persepolensis]SDH32580.1 L-alanine dehydrogenase [Alteribacillus persepolensis]